jgi:DNA-binding response OmpR family regulator
LNQILAATANKFDQEELGKHMSCEVAVLVVDDEPSVGDALNLILSENGYTAVVAATGLDARSRAGTQRFDIAIIDIGLPDISGLDLVRYLRQINSALPIIIITAQPTGKTMEQAGGLDAVDVLPKPFSPAKILNAIRKGLGQTR